MSDVKALFPIGKTQWRKWNNDQRAAFNEARAEGIPFGEAVAASNSMKSNKKSVAGILSDVAEVAVAISGVTGATNVAIEGVKKTVKAVKGSKKAK